LFLADLSDRHTAPEQLGGHAANAIIHVNVSISSYLFNCDWRKRWGTFHRYHQTLGATMIGATQSNRKLK
jgi:hypothetical protein